MDESEISDESNRSTNSNIDRSLMISEVKRPELSDDVRMSAALLSVWNLEFCCDTKSIIKEHKLQNLPECRRHLTLDAVHSFQRKEKNQYHSLEINGA